MRLAYEVYDGFYFDGYDGKASVVNLPGNLKGVSNDCWSTGLSVDADEPYLYRFNGYDVSVYPNTPLAEYLTNNNIYYIGFTRTVTTLPAALTTIEEEAFRGSSFVEVVVPGTVTSIGSKAFADCKSLQIIHIPSSVTSIASDAFAGSPDVMIITDSWGTLTDWAANHKIPVKVE